MPQLACLLNHDNIITFSKIGIILFPSFFTKKAKSLEVQDKPATSMTLTIIGIAYLILANYVGVNLTFVGEDPSKASLSISIDSKSSRTIPLNEISLCLQLRTNNL